MNVNEHPFLISKPDNEVLEILSKPTIYLSKRLCGEKALNYLFTTKQCSPISEEDTLTFLRKQYKAKTISSEITIAKADCDKLIFNQLGESNSKQILLIKRKFILKDITIAFERIYLIATETEYSL